MEINAPRGLRREQRNVLNSCWSRYRSQRKCKMDVEFTALSQYTQRSEDTAADSGQGLRTLSMIYARMKSQDGILKLRR